MVILGVSRGQYLYCPECLTKKDKIEDNNICEGEIIDNKLEPHRCTYSFGTREQILKKISGNTILKTMGDTMQVIETKIRKGSIVSADAFQCVLGGCMGSSFFNITKNGEVYDLLYTLDYHINLDTICRNVFKKICLFDLLYKYIDNNIDNDVKKLEQVKSDEDVIINYIIYYYYIPKSIEEIKNKILKELKEFKEMFKREISIDNKTEEYSVTSFAHTVILENKEDTDESFSNIDIIKYKSFSNNGAIKENSINYTNQCMLLSILKYIQITLLSRLTLTELRTLCNITDEIWGNNTEFDASNIEHLNALNCISDTYRLNILVKVPRLVNNKIKIFVYSPSSKIDNLDYQTIYIWHIRGNHFQLEYMDSYNLPLNEIEEKKVKPEDLFTNAVQDDTEFENAVVMLQVLNIEIEEYNKNKKVNCCEDLQQKIKDILKDENKVIEEYRKLYHEFEEIKQSDMSIAEFNAFDREDEKNKITDYKTYIKYINDLFLNKIPKSITIYKKNNKDEHKFIYHRFSNLLKNSKKYYQENIDKDNSNIYNNIVGNELKIKYKQEIENKFYKRYILYKYIENFEKNIYSVYNYFKTNYYKYIEIKNKHIKNKINKIYNKFSIIGNLLEKEKLLRNNSSYLHTEVIEFYNYIAMYDFLEDYSIIYNFIMYGEDYIENKYFNDDGKKLYIV